MISEDYINVNHLCSHHRIDLSFFIELDEFGLIEIKTIEESYYIHQDIISDVEKMIRLRRELNLNVEGIDIVFNLLSKVDNLQIEVTELQNRLRLYEGL